MAMEDYTDIILLSRDLMMHKEEANTLECDKMRLKRCIEKLKQDMEYEKLNLERDKKRLKKGQQTYAKLCNAKSELHKSFLEKERLKQTMDEDAKQLRYKITTMSNQLEMEQADVQKLAMDDFHDEEFDENASNEIMLSLETTGQELVLYAQDLFCLNKKIKQSSWRLKYLSCQLTPDSIACDLSSEDEENAEGKKSPQSDCQKSAKPRSTSVCEVQATAELHCSEVQASSVMTIKSAQTELPVIANNSVQTTEQSKSATDKCTETKISMETAPTQTDEIQLLSLSPKKSEIKIQDDRRGSKTSKTSVSFDLPLAESTRLVPTEETFSVKYTEEIPVKVAACDSLCSQMMESTNHRMTETWNDHFECPSSRRDTFLDCPTNRRDTFLDCPTNRKDTFLDCPSARKDTFLECSCICKTQNKVTQTVKRCVDEIEDFPTKCIDSMKDQTCQTSRPDPEINLSTCTPICQQPCSVINNNNNTSNNNNCPAMYQSYYAPRMSPLCYTNECACTPPMMMYSRDCTPTYCNLTTPNQVPVRECASPPEQLGSMLPLPKNAGECRDMQSDQYPTKDESDVNRDIKMKSAPNFVHYPTPTTHTMPASYPTISPTKNQQMHQPQAESWPQDNEMPKQDYPPNFSTENFFNPNLPTQDTRNNLNSASNSQNRDDSYYQVNVSPPEDCWTEIQSRFTGLLSLYTSDRMTANSDSDLDSVISTRPTFHSQPKQKTAAKSTGQVSPQKKTNRTYK